MIAKLSYNVLGVVYKFLEPMEILRLERVCKKFREAAQMDHIWRVMCTRTWSFIHNYKNETWKESFKRRKRSLMRMEDGKSSDYLMLPLRAHKNFITALRVMDEGIISADADGDVLFWTEDDSQYADEDPDPFAPMKVCKLDAEVREFHVHPSKKFITALKADNSFETFDFAPEERKVEHKRTTRVEAGQISFIGVHEDTVLVFSIGQREIPVYDCMTGLCLQKIPYKGYDIRGNAQFMFEIHRDRFEKNLFATWKTYLFVCFNKLIEGRVIQFVEKYDLKQRRTADSINLPSESQAVIVSGDLLFVVLLNGILVYDPNTLKLLSKYNFAMSFYTHFSVVSKGPVFTIYMMVQDNFDLVAFDLNLGTKQIKKKKLAVDHKKGHSSTINSISSFENKLATASDDMTVAVWDMATGTHLYRLQGGSMIVKPKSFVDNPRTPGISIVEMNEGRIVVAIGNLIRVYAFDVPN